MKKWRAYNSRGYSIPELIVAIVILTTLVLGVMGTYAVLLGSAGLAKKKAAGLGLATSQLEYLRSLSYDDLAVQGGAIDSSGPKIPASKEEQSGPYTFVVTTAIQYVDDAYDGCFNYPAGQEYLCRNGPAVTGKPKDTNPRDYKIADVVVTEKNSSKEVTRVSTQIAARVAETAGNTGALSVTALDSLGQPVAGATILVENSTLNPVFSQSQTTDVNGVALFLDVRPDSGKDFKITASKSSYSSLSTIGASGSLAPTYPNVSVLTQQATSSTMQIDVLAPQSLKVSVVNEAGAPQPGAKFSIKGGIKLYTNSQNSDYSYTENAITTDTNGEFMFENLTPGPYSVCFASEVCSSGRYLHVAQSAYGDNSFQPFIIRPGTTSESGSGPMQHARLVVTNDSSAVRITSINPASFVLSDTTINNAQFTISGKNLSGAVVQLRQGATTLSTTVVGGDSQTVIRRKLDLSARPGAWEVVVTKNGHTFVQTGITPGMLGGINVLP